MPKTPTFDFVLHDALAAGAKVDLEKTMVIFMLCGRGEMSRKRLKSAIKAWHELSARIKKNQGTTVQILVDGYDDDPRELWQIPEVCVFVQKFCAETNAHNEVALEPMSRNVLLLCGADGPRIYRPISLDYAEQQTQDFIDARMKEGDK